MPTREIYWNVEHGALIYLLLAAAAAAMGWGIWRRVRLWKRGRTSDRLGRPAERMRGLLVELLAQRRLLRDPFAGVAHLLIFYGFLALLVATSLIALQEWTGLGLLRGRFYLGYSLLSDAFGILGLVGIGMALWRRAVLRPARLHSVVDDWVALGLLLALFVQGFVVEGIRIALTELREQPDLALWSPGGYVMAIVFDGIDPARLRYLHRLHWWIHAATAFAFLAWLVSGRLAHALYGLLNVYLRDLAPTGRLAFPDIEAALERDPDAIPELGVERIEQWGWKALLDLDACMGCGRCEEVCPAHLSGGPLSPRKLVLDLRGQLEGAGAGRAGPLFGGPDAGAAVLEAELWGCRTCGACQRECPVYVEHVPKIVDMRRHLVMVESRMEEAAEQLLRSIDERLHPWTGSPVGREDWLRDLDVKRLGRGERAEWLFWVGCTGALVERNVRVTRAVARVLEAAGVDFAVLGAEEACTGDPARRIGAEYGFQQCARRNVATLERYGVGKIVTGCPHCLNTLANEYPDFGGSYEVVHHTELIRERLATGHLSLRGGELSGLTYHDPCYLGRHNGVYDAPREVLVGLTGPGGLRELPRRRSRSLCCGAGGGHAWLEDRSERRVSELRLAEVRASGAQIAAVACPFCLQMLEGSAGAGGADGGPRLADVAELVAEALP